MDISIIFALILGITAGLFSSWITRLGKNIIKIYENLGLPTKFLLSLRIIIDCEIYLFVLMLILIISYLF